MDINRIVITGNLASDPELRDAGSESKVCRLRLASTSRRREPDGSWSDYSNYFDVVVWGAAGENAARYLTKGSPVAVDGRLHWREWKTESRESRQAVEIVAQTLQFLPTS